MRLRALFLLSMGWWVLKLAFDPGRSPHCVLSWIWFYETLNLRLRPGVRGGGVSLLSTVADTFVDSNSWRGTFAKILRVKF